MKIYDVPAFPNPARVRIALAEKNATDKVTFEEIDVMAGEHRNATYLEKNPAGAVPILELDDGSCISECSAITEYIDHTFEGIALTGSNAKERAVVNMMNRRAESMVLDAVGAYFHHATDGLGPELETYQNADWGQKQKEKATAGMKYFDGLLASNAFVTGENFTAADITLFAGLAFADFAKIEIPSDYAHLQEWRAKVAARPSIAN
ncbi:MAG: glutathione S-transferase family protein [Arenicella sp.]